MDSRYVEVMSVLTDYFDGLYNSDPSKLAKALHPMAQYVCVTDGKFLRLTMDEYFPIVASVACAARTIKRSRARYRYLCF